MSSRHFILEREHMFKKKDKILLLSKHVLKRKMMSQYVREVSDLKGKCHSFLLLRESLSKIFEKSNSLNYIMKIYGIK